MTALGTSFTRWRAEDRGLEYREAFDRVCQMGFAVIRLSASWREVSEFGWTHLDWLIRHAEAAGQSVILTVGMKALGWPEFYLPQGLDPGDPLVRRRALEHVRETVLRFAPYRNLVGWQIENEPFNRSGPHSRWIPRSVVFREAQAVRSLDQRRRPLIVTTFGHFNPGMDQASSRHQSKWKRRFGLDIAAEREALAVLRRGDILGVDVYRSIGWLDQEQHELIGRAAGDQFDWLARWHRIARQQQKRFWVTEAQAEPWEARARLQGEPLTVSPGDITSTVERLAGIGAEMILLWGCEYWLWRAQNGDSRWLEAVALGRRALA